MLGGHTGSIDPGPTLVAEPFPDAERTRRLDGVYRNLSSLPRAERRQVFKAVSHGRPVDDPRHANAALECAQRYHRWWLSLGLLWLVLGLSNLGFWLMGGTWFNLALGICWAGSAPYWLWISWGAKRSIPHNTALAIHNEPPPL